MLHPAVQAILAVAGVGLAGWMFSAMGYTIAAWRSLGRKPGPEWVEEMEQQMAGVVERTVKDSEQLARMLQMLEGILDDEARPRQDSP